MPGAMGPRDISSRVGLPPPGRRRVRRVVMRGSMPQCPANCQPDVLEHGVKPFNSS